MKYIFIIITCLVIMGAGMREIQKQRQKTAFYDQWVRLISFLKTELNYRKPDCETLYNSAIENGFDCIGLSDGLIVLNGNSADKATEDLTVFLKSIGTTDADGQLSLCDEYQQRLKSYLDEQRSVEKSKTQVDFAVSLLGVFCVIVLFM